MILAQGKRLNELRIACCFPVAVCHMYIQRDKGITQTSGAKRTVKGRIYVIYVNLSN